MENSGLISVIIPVYNAENWLQRCLDSIYRNTYQNLEVICVNDGSTDGSLNILKAQPDPRIVIIDQNNAGVSAARNAGLDIAHGEFIAFVDPDDWVHHRYFERLTRTIGTCDIACCESLRTKEMVADAPIGDTAIRILDSEAANQIENVKVPVWGKLYRRSTIGTTRFAPEVKIQEDKLFNLRILARKRTVVMVNVPMYYYFQRADSAVHQFGGDLCPVGMEYMRLAEKNNSAQMLKAAYGAFLSKRYYHMFDCSKTEELDEVNRLLKCCNRLSRELFPISQRYVMGAMTCFPVLYRLWRISKDRTLLAWERNERRKRRQTRRVWRQV